MVSAGNAEGQTNILTIAWTGTICTNPAMLYISVRPERYSYSMIKESGEFVVNLTTEELAKATDYCGVRSGRDVDKWKEMHLTRGKAKELQYAPIIEECPVNIECKVEEIKELGSHHMFIAKVMAVQVSEEYMNETGKFCLNETGLLAYSHGEYLGLGKTIGTFGYSDKKKRNVKVRRKDFRRETSILLFLENIYAHVKHIHSVEETKGNQKMMRYKKQHLHFPCYTQYVCWE